MRLEGRLLIVVLRFDQGFVMAGAAGKLVDFGFHLFRCLGDVLITRDFKYALDFSHGNHRCYFDKQEEEIVARSFIKKTRRLRANSGKTNFRG